MIYFIEAVGIGHIKIGCTDKDDALQRVAELQTGSPVPLRVLATIPGDSTTEKDLHRRFAAHRVCGEWFKPAAELLALIPAGELPRCEGTEVVAMPVRIRVLTVGRKRFTKALLGQLPRGRLFDFPRLWLQLGDDPSAETVRTATLAFYPSCDYWGWTHGHYCANLLFVQQQQLFVESCCRKIDAYALPPGDQLFPSRGQMTEDQLVSRARIVTTRRKNVQAVWDRSWAQWLAEEHHLYSGV